MKIKWTLVLTLVMLSFNISAAFAAPAFVSTDDNGTATDLISVKKPESYYVATTKQDYVVSAVAKPGVKVALYRREGDSANFSLIYNGGLPVEQVIGASGLYARNIRLNEGANYILVRAEANMYSYQVVKFDINLVGQSFLDQIFGFPVKIDGSF